IEPLAAVAKSGRSRLARIHAIWALGQMASKEEDIGMHLTPLLRDPDAEIRAQAARVAGWGHWALTLQLTELMQDAEPRVRFHAAMAFSRIRWTALQTPSNSFRRRSADAVRRIFAENASGDPYVRHAAVKALAVLPLIVEVRRLARDELSSVRFGALLALR